jgi:hypothetical protein
MPNDVRFDEENARNNSTTHVSLGRNRVRTANEYDMVKQNPTVVVTILRIIFMFLSHTMVSLLCTALLSSNGKRNVYTTE